MTKPLALKVSFKSLKFNVYFSFFFQDSRAHLFVAANTREDSSRAIINKSMIDIFCRWENISFKLVEGVRH